MAKTDQKFITYDSQKRQFACQDEWTMDTLVTNRNKLKKFTLTETDNIIIDGSSIKKMDSAGAYLLREWTSELEEKGFKVSLKDFSDQYTKLLSMVKKETSLEDKTPTLKKTPWLAKLGKGAVNQLDEFCDYLSFLGNLAAESLRVLGSPRHFRISALTNTIDQTGIRALPIIALLSFMIGVVLAYQMGTQLKSYGANVFIVDLLGLSVLREFGPLLTAIMVAGRTGSAFTAQLGTMRVNQEIDALDTMGVTPAELLLLPRIIGLVIALPLLTVWADAFGILGGMVMANSLLGLSWAEFLLRFEHQVPLKTLMLGLGKTPVFALIVATIGCFQGMRVKGSADSVGTQTTRSVVLSIFFIIVADALFSILFSKFKL